MSGCYTKGMGNSNGLSSHPQELNAIFTWGREGAKGSVLSVAHRIDSEGARTGDLYAAAWDLAEAGWTLAKVQRAAS